MTSDRALLTFDEAADLCARELAPGGHITARTLRTERDKGRLGVVKLGGRIYTTRRDLELMIERARCPDHARDHASTSDRAAPAAPPSTSSSMERAKSAQAAAQTALEMLRPPSRATSPASTRRPARPARASATS